MKAGSKKIGVSVAGALALALSWVHANAHHSFSAEFDIGKPVEITGTVTQIEWTNPHTWVHLEALDAEGNRIQWAVELLGVNALARSGVTRQTVKPGDLLTVTGFQARNGTHTANASSMIRADTGERLWASSAE